MKKEEINLLFETVKQCQNVLTNYINPDSELTEKETINQLLGFLDSKQIVTLIKEIEISKSIPTKIKIDVNNIIIERVKPIFDDLKHINKLDLFAFGTFYKYECAGEFYSYIIMEEDSGSNNISDDDYEIIYEKYNSGDISDLERKIEKKYGWPLRGGYVIGVERIGDMLSVFCDDYDPE